ncbi:DUF1592 domain-containing protein [Rubripirellula amarantea]|nr:DUF1592 domain-containing protein [Rubripirellula amarantea]
MILRSTYVALLVVTFCGFCAPADAFEDQVSALIEKSCIDCHDASTDTELNFDSLGHDLSDAATFHAWERVFDRVSKGEMPPATAERPEARLVGVALASLKKSLLHASTDQQRRVGRVPARRLTKTELSYTLRDLLKIQSDVTSDVPDEVESGSFDTVGANQRISAVHMESYLKAANQALDIAINLDRNPFKARANDFGYLDEWHEKPLNQGGSVTRKLPNHVGYALFRDLDYLTHFQFPVTVPGTHRISAEVAAFQTASDVTAKLIVKDQSGSARLIKAIDVPPGDPKPIVVETFLQPGDIPYLTLDLGPNNFGVFTAGGAKHYRGPGLAVFSQKVEGPVFASWPPPSTYALFRDAEIQSKGDRFEVRSNDDALSTLRNQVADFAPRAFRRPVTDDEIDRFVELAKPAINEGRDLVSASRIVLCSILSSPQFLLFEGEPGRINDYAFASRLSYFLWKSMPDDELFSLAAEGKLSGKVLTAQIDRMLDDEKSQRFVQDFLGQWMRLDKINATTPDEKLYPEYDELLANAISQEPELFFAEFIRSNLSVRELIDSDFTFLNSRLAKLYGIEGVEGLEFRKVQLPANSPRGGILTQAATLKTTANGTTTSPVTRGNFVLTNFLGTPPSPPPAGIGSIEPDTRGKTTIREILAAHRNIETCNQCHREIDPPGFALESFDPIGQFRTHYRVSGSGGFLAAFSGATFHDGPQVDASGTTADGEHFDGIEEFKQHLVREEDQVARHFVSQLIVYSTGSEIQFADRMTVDGILEQSKNNQYRVRDIIHAVIQSEVFRIK